MDQIIWKFILKMIEYHKISWFCWLRDPRTLESRSNKWNFGKIKKCFQNQIEIKMMLQPDFKKFCWNCNIGGAETSEELKERCLGEGSYQACSSGNSDCFVTMRKNEGKVNMLQMGCKQPAACANESSQTMQGQSPHCRHSFITGIWDGYRLESKTFWDIMDLGIGP